MKTLSQFITLGIATLLLVAAFSLLNSTLISALYFAAFIILIRFLPMNVNIIFVVGVLMLSMIASSLFRYVHYDLLWFPYAAEHGYQYWQLVDAARSLREIIIFYISGHLIFLRPFILNDYFKNEEHSITPADPLLIKIFKNWLIKLEATAITCLLIHFVCETFVVARSIIEAVDFVLIYLLPNIKLLMLAFALTYAFTELKEGGEISPRHS